VPAVVHVTLQDKGEAGIVRGVDVAIETFSAFWGPGVAEHDAGRLKLKARSILTGPNGPLLWAVAWAVTVNGVPGLAVPGPVTETLLTFTSAS
jgi:hypothetical protein